MNILEEYTDEQVREIAERSYPCQQGIWTLVAPNGDWWTAESPLECVTAEMNSRVPAIVQLARIRHSLTDKEQPK